MDAATTTGLVSAAHFPAPRQPGTARGHQGTTPPD